MREKIDKNKLTIPIYLNTKIVFDMLATIEDGFSEVKNIQTSKSKNREEDAEANIGMSNLFALFSVGLKGNLKTNPLIEMLFALKELMALANLFSDKPKNNQSKKDKLMSDAKFNAQIEGLINGLQAGGKKDIICEASGLKVVLPTDENYFLNNNMSEITDGNYKILGKVVQIYKDSGEISLLRNTVFSKLQLDKMKEFQDVFNDPALADFIGNGGITTTIEAPVIMIIPIAIYV